MDHEKSIRGEMSRPLRCALFLVAISWCTLGCDRPKSAQKPVADSATTRDASHVVVSRSAGEISDAGNQPSPIAKQVGVAGDHSYILTSQGIVWAMGSNEFGAIGLTKDVKQTSVPSKVPGVAGASQIATGTWHACAVTEGERALCWGRNFGGAVGNGSVKNEYFVGPSEVVDLSNVAEVGAAGTHSCARLNDGTARCWGCVISGTVERPKVLPKLMRATALAIAPESSCARLEDKRVACWDVLLGKDFDYGDAISDGDGNVKPVSPVPKLSDVKQVSVSATHACAVTEAGLVFCWGKGSEGELGTGNSGEGYRLLLPVEVSTLSEIDSVSAGTGYSCAIHRSGDVSCWGQNGHGQLGLGDRRLRVRPEMVPGLTHIAAVALGTSHSCALSRHGEAYCWGRNHRGQLGQRASGPADVRTTPMRVTW